MKSVLAVHQISDPLSKIEDLIKLSSEMTVHLNLLVLGTLSSITYAGAGDMSVYVPYEDNKQILMDAENRVAEVTKLIQEADCSASAIYECCEPAILRQVVRRYALVSSAVLFAGGSITDNPVLRDTFYGSVFDAGRPALKLGAGKRALPPFKKVMMAWDGEQESANAIHRSLSWLSNSSDIHLATVDPEPNDTGPNPGDDMASFLARQNFSVTVDRLPSSDRSISRVLNEHATDLGANLIVMGAYGHSRLREWLLGGTTREMLEQDEFPLFLAH